MAKSEDKSQKLDKDLKSGIENLSGFNLDNVKVHYNSETPSQLKTYNIQEDETSDQKNHLSDRIKPHVAFNNGLVINNDAQLEKEANAIGRKATSKNKKL